MRLFPKRRIADQRTNSGAKARDVSSPGESLETQGGQKRRSLLWQPFVIGGLAFFLVTGGTILNPGNIRWLMDGDREMNLLGWMFFRNAPVLQQPFGANWQYGMEISSSTVYSDSISLLAFPFKLIKACLPEPFQYFGIWTLLCFLLQSFFAWKLLDRLTDGVWHKVFATLFFVLAPPFLWRIHWHLSLGGHWLILAALYLYFSCRFRPLPWILVLLAASLITPILLAMTILVFLAALVKHYSNGELSVLGGIKTLATTIPLLLFTMWEAGYFMVSAVGAGGFGYYRTSLLGFIDPGIVTGDGGASWSYLLRNLPKAPGNYEGYCFLGTGMILLLVVAGAEMLRCRAASIDWRRLWPLLLVFAFSVVFALSNSVAIGPHVIFHYDVPPILERFIDPFRASGRFIWLAYYMIMVGVLTVVLKGFGRTASLLLISLCFIVQVVDSWKAMASNMRAYEDRSTQASLDSPFWRNAARRYKKILYVLPRDAWDNYALCFFAAANDLPINIGHWARFDANRLEAARLKLFESIKDGQLDSDALYVFESAPCWEWAALRIRHGDSSGVVDGFKIIAPDWGRQDTLAGLTQVMPEYQLGSQLMFMAGGEDAKYLAVGWSEPESWGVWSEGDSASVVLMLAQEPTSDLILQVDGVGFVSTKCPQQEIEVFVNSTNVGRLSYSLQNSNGSRWIRVPREVVVGVNDAVEIDFRFKNDVSPSRLGISGDPRSLALGLKGLTLKSAESSRSPGPGFR